MLTGFHLVCITSTSWPVTYHFVSDVEVTSSAHNGYATILNRWYMKYTIEGTIALSLIALSIVFINGTTQVG